MPSWIITCRNCQIAFEHARISNYTLRDFLDPAKPAIPSEGIGLLCPRCGHVAIYARTDLFYRQ
jgi:hypothetical protein